MVRSPTLSPNPEFSPPPPRLASTPPSASLPLDSLSKPELIALVDKLNESYELAQHRLENLEAHPQDDVSNEDEARTQAQQLEKELNHVRDRELEWRRDQERMEEELAGRIEVLDKLRASVRDLERDKRDASKRYREQADSFDSERQSWYDQEQHYKVRIQNLTSERKKLRDSKPTEISEDDPEPRLEGSNREATGEDLKTPIADASFSESRSSSPNSASPAAQSPISETERALRAQLDSLSTAHGSLTTTLRTLQTEMTDLKRVYQDLQEENESYQILLGEKTLSGEVTGTDFFRKSFSWGADVGLESPNNSNALTGGFQPGWSGFGFQGGLEAVGEEDLDEIHESDSSESSDPDEDEDDIEKILLESQGTGTVNSGAVSAQSPKTRRASRRTRSIALAHAKRDSSSVPALGGLDLAAELEAAQHDQTLDEVEIERKREKEDRKNKKREERERKKREARGAKRDGSQSMPIGIEELHLEIKQLREANKALTLYVSKIVDRVCSQEGFEKVLAVDYRNNNTPKADDPSPQPAGGPALVEPPAETKKPRPTSTSFFSRASASPNLQEPSTPKTAASTSTGLAATPSSASSVGSNVAPRKSGGLSWDGISSVFGFGSASASSSTSLAPSPSFSSSLSRSNTATSTTTTRSNNSPGPANPGIKPFMLDPRRLSIADEDEDDILERERLRLDMSRHGIDYAPTLAQIGRTAATPSPIPSPAATTTSVVDPIEQAEQHLRNQEREEEVIRQQMKEGRGSGFTDPPQRRMSKLERRHSSRASSISYNISAPASSSSLPVAGLGIETSLSTSSSSSPGRSASPSVASPVEDGRPVESGDLETTANTQTWTKALRRMSKGWSSPPMS
ncbi:uncharacterized protein JCM15063_005998 [Sporobolomyces koalae]|uniref:uncharacterized protein n=1 Tax=Sporobolomyces koalae TaxID=500713 RepID=UPI00317550A6